MRGRYFPWRLFWRFFAILALLLNGFQLLVTGVASHVFHFPFYSLVNSAFLFGFFLFSLMVSAFFAYRFTNPLRGVILKALRLANRKQAEALGANEEAELLTEEPGEYFELEMALERIQSKMRRRRKQLAHEREESQALMSAIEDAVVSLSPEGRILFFNAGFATHFLTREQVEQARAGLLNLAEVFRDPEVLNLVQRVFTAGASGSLQRQMSTVMSLGRIFSITVLPLREERGGQVYGTICVFHDISELKKAEKVRIEFVENASHELRTPLTSIKGFLATLKEDFEAGRLEQVPQFLGILTKNVDRLNELVGDLLTISSLEQNSSVELEVFNPDHLTLDVIERLAGMAAEKKIVLRSFSKVEEMKADTNKVEQVLMNLVGNAIKYIQVGGQVDIFWDYDHEKKFILLRVKDNGPGIATEHLARLFERFYRVDKGRSRDVGGTGLGLAIVKHILLSHGGTVTVKSDLGQGAEFVCAFPVR